MAKFPNTDPFNGYSTQWTQPYLPTSYNPFYTHRALTIAQEMERIEQIDSWVDAMHTYPDAVKILQSVNKNL